MTLLITRDGQVRSLYQESIPLESVGRSRVTRASSVEWDASQLGGQGGWVVTPEGVPGPVLGPFRLRSEALAAEAQVYGAIVTEGK